MSLLISISLSNKNMAGNHTHINVINNLFFSFGFFSLLCPSLFLISPLTGSKRPSVTLPSSYFFSLLFLSKEEEKRRKIKYKFSGFFFCSLPAYTSYTSKSVWCAYFHRWAKLDFLLCAVWPGRPSIYFISFHFFLRRDQETRVNLRSLFCHFAHATVIYGKLK